MGGKKQSKICEFDGCSFVAEKRLQELRQKIAPSNLIRSEDGRLLMPLNYKNHSSALPKLPPQQQNLNGIFGGALPYLVDFCDYADIATLRLVCRQFNSQTCKHVLYKLSSPQTLVLDSIPATSQPAQIVE